MNEYQKQAKLEEAQHFLDEMLTSLDDPKKFRHNLSAFLSSARTALQFAEREAKPQPGGREWWKSVDSNRILRSLVRQRDRNVHEEAVRPITQTRTSIGFRARIGMSVEAVRKDAQGNVISRSSSTEPIAKPETEDEAMSMTRRYLFKDWKGDEDVPTVCRMYLNELGTIVEEGRNKGFLAV